VARFDAINGGEETKVSHQRLDLLLRGMGDLPTLPAVAARVIELACQASREARPSAAGVVNAIRADAALAVWLLRRGRQSSPRSAETVLQAAESLGDEALLSEALCVPVPASRDGGADGQGLDLVEFWKHCIACAAGAEAIASVVSPPVNGELAFTCGLLHDLGKLVLWLLFPKSYSRVVAMVRRGTGNIAEHERDVIGLDHTVAGRRLAASWRLGETLEQVIWLHHQPVEAMPPHLPAWRMTCIVALADAVARQARLGFSGNYSLTPADQLASHLRLDPGVVEHVASELPRRVSEHIGQLALAEPAGERRLSAAILAANVELGRRNRGFRLELSQVRDQAGATRDLRLLAASLAQAASTPDALVGIAGTVLSAVGGAGRGPVVAYSIDAQLGEVTVARAAQGADPELLLLAAGDAEALLGAADPNSLSPRLVARLVNVPDWPAGPAEMVQGVHRPLTCGGRWVGGIVHSHAADMPDAAVELVAMALAIVQASARAAAMSEEMSIASQRLVESQAALADARTRSAIGQMAAGAAHQINTPLAVISGRAQLMRDRAADQQERQTWQLIADRAQEISDTVTDLVAFASPQPPRPQMLEPGRLVREAVDRFRNSDHPQAASAIVDIEAGEGLAPVWVDRDQIVEALAAVVANAAAASPAGRPVRLRAEMDEPTGKVIVSVADTGEGMDAQTLQQAFTPLVSRQKAGRRRGMGLPKAKRNVENNGGRIWIDSRAGQGATVYLELPGPAGPR